VKPGSEIRRSQWPEPGPYPNQDHIQKSLNTQFNIILILHSHKFPNSYPPGINYTSFTRLIIPSLFYLLVHSRCRGFVISFDRTQTHTTVGRTPLDEGSARRRDLYLTTQTLYKTNIHAGGGIRTHNPSKRSAADPHRRPHGHWDRLYIISQYQISPPFYINIVHKTTVRYLT
jgi:hypothetical protein